MFFYFFDSPHKSLHEKVKLIDTSTPKALVASFCTGSFAPFRKKFFFRGEGNGESLIPSLLRNDNYSRFCCVKKSNLQAGKTPLNEFLKTEYIILHRFYFEANQAGLVLPETESFTRWDCSPGAGIFPHSIYIHDLAHLMALGDHYGLSTRMLDFSFDPLTAIYFACSHLHHPASNKPIILYLLDKTLFVEKSRIRCVVPEYFKNPNLKAQNGALVYWAVSKSESFVGDEVKDPEDKIEFDSFGKIHDINKYLYEINITRSFSTRLLSLLDAMGYNSQSLFPNYADIASHICPKPNR